MQFAELLTQQSATGPYFLGQQFSLADVALAPFVQRISALNKEFLGGFYFEAIKNSPRLGQWILGNLKRPSVQETYLGDEKFAEGLAKRTGLTRQ